MALYYLKRSVPNEPMPDDPVDANVRIDYGKLRHLVTVNRDLGARLNGNFDLLRHVAGEGEVDADINSSFPLDRLTERENFLSLLHYFGLLSIRSAARGRARLGIPNQTVRRLLYGHLRDGWKDVSAFSADVYEFSNLVVAMAYEGAWRPVVDYLAKCRVEALQTKVCVFDGELPVDRRLVTSDALKASGRARATGPRVRRLAFRLFAALAPPAPVIVLRFVSEVRRPSVCPRL